MVTSEGQSHLFADEFIAATGGAVTSEDYPPFLRDRLSQMCTGTLLFSRWWLSVGDSKTGLHTRLELVNSPFFTCRAKEVSEGEYVVVVPLGLVCRLYVLAHLLLGYWNSDKFYVPVRQSEKWQVPPGLQPLFGKARNEGDGPWWAELEDLFARVEISHYDAVRLTEVALMYVIGHEAAHAYRRHGKALEALRLRGLVRDETEEAVFRRFAETDADLMGTHWALDAQWIGLRGSGQLDEAGVAYLRMSYAVTMVHALYDVHRKEIGAYQTGAYCHPVVRRHFFTEASHQMAHAYPLQSTGWVEAELEGWGKCLWALHGLNKDVLVGRFGKAPEGYTHLPVSALQYNMSEGLKWTNDFGRETVLYRAVRRIYRDTVDFSIGETPPAVDFHPAGRDVWRRAMASDDPVIRTAMSMLGRHFEASTKDLA
ncbi:hypothetical protein B1H19_31440 [Streptomyces gilvosporeus]|uniref:Uncharacterized protein n=1 Tax=Streptomyces gilvosporeus TaxID=553510 RepID=A0A1V0TYS5_9ACTN|nr:hypothetical protein B1H19_31440 [Streptomyces gilvosporeus]